VLRRFARCAQAEDVATSRRPGDADAALAAAHEAFTDRCGTWCYTWTVPTNRRRHTITETDGVEQALAPLRAEGVDVDFGELVIRGARAKLDELHAARDDEVRRRALREQFLARTSSAEGFDLEAAVSVREHGWTRS